MSEQSRIKIHLPYFKQGDDMDHAVRESKNSADACGYLIEQLTDACEQLHLIGIIIENRDDIMIDAGTHSIEMSGPKEILQKIVNKKLGSWAECDDITLQE